MRTIFPEETQRVVAHDTELTQNPPESQAEPEKNVRFPMRIKHRGRELATIYRPSDAYPNYRVCYRADGKRVMKGFARYGDAKKWADAQAEHLYKGSASTSLTDQQARDALTAFGHLRDFYLDTGIRLTLAGLVADCTSSMRKLNGRTLAEAVDGFLSAVATVRRKDIAEAVNDFIAADEPRTKSNDGKRAQLSAKYAYNRAIMLRRFASTFPGNSVCDLTKDHLDTFMGSLGDLPSKSRNKRKAASPKSRNHQRAAIRQFLDWCVRKDYLSPTHRLGEASALRPERANTCEVEFYTPAEFTALLDAAQGPMRAMVAIGGLAGLRTSELLKLTWEDTRRVESHIEVSSGKAKTRQRRLIESVPALVDWLAQFQDSTGKIWPSHEITFQQHFCKLCETAQQEIKGKKLPVTRKPNGLRHAFVTYHLALNGNESTTAMQAGNSPAMVHGNYKGLATKKEAEAWFAVRPL